MKGRDNTHKAQKCYPWLWSHEFSPAADEEEVTKSLTGPTRFFLDVLQVPARAKYTIRPSKSVCLSVAFFQRTRNLVSPGVIVEKQFCNNGNLHHCWNTLLQLWGQGHCSHTATTRDYRKNVLEHHCCLFYFFRVRANQ
jgi:hypothetical protein